MIFHDRLHDRRLDACWSNVTRTALRLAWPHRINDDRPSLFITDSSGTRLLTVNDCMPAWERDARTALDDAA